MLKRLGLGSLVFLLGAWLVLAQVSTAGPAAAHPSSPSTRTFYVSAHGGDRATGLSPSHAIGSMAKASALALRPGDRLLLERGGNYDGLLSVASSGTDRAPIVVGAYGHGPRPSVTGQCIDLAGSWIHLHGLRAHGCATGVLTRGQHNTIRRVQADHNMFGVEIASGADHNRVERSHLEDNTTMARNTPGRTDDYGAIGVLVQGDHARVSHNLFRGQVARSADFGTDGSAVEIYGAIGTRVDHNVAKDNRAFTELGNARTRDTRYVANVSRSKLPASEFLVTRGFGDEFGPVAGTTATHNLVANTGPEAQGFWCAGGCTASTLTLTGNMIYAAARVGYVQGRIGGRRNTYGGGVLEFPLLPGDRFVPSLLSTLVGGA
jgi:hypothetical protein